MFQEGCSGSRLALDTILPYRALSSPLPTERVQVELQRLGAAGSPEGSVVGFIKKVVFPSLLSHWGGGVSFILRIPALKTQHWQVGGASREPDSP